MLRIRIGLRCWSENFVHMIISPTQRMSRIGHYMGYQSRSLTSWGQLSFVWGKANPLENAEKPHTHQKLDNDTDEFWDQILVYLMNMKLLSNPDEARKVKNRANTFFILENVLWQRNGMKPPLQVVLEPSHRMHLTKEAHDNSSHWGKDPTFHKLHDSFWWLNQYAFVQEYCKTCHECQMHSLYQNKIPIEPTYVQTILHKFSADTVHMPLGKGGYKYVVDLRDKWAHLTFY